MTAATRLNPGLTRFSVQLLLRPPSQDEEFIPEPLRDHPYRVDSEESYQELYGFLTGQAGVPLPELGPAKQTDRFLSLRNSPVFTPTSRGSFILSW